MFPAIELKAGKDRKVANFHPWVYRDEIARVDRTAERMAETGGIVALRDAAGSLLAKGWYSPKARLAVRVLTRDVQEDLDTGFFVRRIARARALRERALPAVMASWSGGGADATTGVRAVHAEADDLPGIVVDGYAGHLVVQFRYAGADSFKRQVVEALEQVWKPRGIWERSDMEGRKEEGLAKVAGPLAGEVPPEVEFEEDGSRFRAAVQTGHKTGFYLDQRDNRARLAARIRPGMRVLDAFSSTGAFSVTAARAGAQVVAVEKDPEAARMVTTHAELNGVADRVRVENADAFEALPRLAEAEPASFDIAIVDPPAIAKKKEEQGKARWGFVTLSTSALRMLKPGGLLFVSSCAYHLSPGLLQETVRIAGGQTGQRLRVVDETFQPADHPWILQIPETLYLKSLLVEVQA